MFRSSALLPAAAAIGLLSACVSEGVTKNEPFKVVEVVEASATVQTVDPASREILLTDNATGESFVVTAGEEVKNFGQIESGDQVKVAYSLGRAARMAMPGATGSSSASVVGAAEPGQKPGLAMGQVTSAVVEFLSYDAATSQATIVDPEGVTRTVTVETPEGREFASKLKKGDKVEVTFTEALAIVVEEQ